MIFHGKGESSFRNVLYWKDKDICVLMLGAVICFRYLNTLLSSETIWRVVYKILGVKIPTLRMWQSSDRKERRVTEDGFLCSTADGGPDVRLPLGGVQRPGPQIVRAVVTGVQRILYLCQVFTFFFFLSNSGCGENHEKAISELGKNIFKPDIWWGLISKAYKELIQQLQKSPRSLIKK